MPNTKYLMREIDATLDRCLYKLREDREELYKAAYIKRTHNEREAITQKLRTFEELLPAKRHDHLAFNPLFARLYCKLCNTWYVSAWEFEYMYHDRCEGCGCSSQQIVTISKALDRVIRRPGIDGPWTKPSRHGVNPLTWMKKLAQALPLIIARLAS